MDKLKLPKEFNGLVYAIGKRCHKYGSRDDLRPLPFDMETNVFFTKTYFVIHDKLVLIKKSPHITPGGLGIITGNLPAEFFQFMPRKAVVTLQFIQHYRQHFRITEACLPNLPDRPDRTMHPQAAPLALFS